MKKVILLSSVILLGCDREIASQNELIRNATNEMSLEHHFDICNSLEIKLSSVSKDKSDKIFYDFQKKYIAIINKLNTKIDLNGFTEKSRPSRWIKILMSEGMPYIAPNWKYLQKRFGKYLSQAYNCWLIHLDKTENIIDDAALLVTPDDLRNSIIFLEHLSEKNPSFIAIKDVKSRLSWYLDLYLNGSDNSPMLDKHGLRPEFRTSYEKFLSKNRDSKYYSKIRFFLSKHYGILK